MSKIESSQDFIKGKVKQFKEEKEKGKIVKMKDIGRKGKLIFTREAWTFMPQGNLSRKVFVIERFRKGKSEGKHAYKESWKEGDIEYRIGYYIVGKIGRAKDKWVWGQYCPIIPMKDFDKLIQKAKKEKTILK